MKKSNLYLFVFLFCIFGFFNNSSQSEETPKFTKKVLKNVKLFSQGKKVWFDQCTHCHGYKAYPGKAPKLKPKKYNPEWVFKRVTKGFRKMYRLTNDGQTPDGADFVQIVQHIEAQNIATSGWNYVSSSNNITLSFYVRASVSQTYHGYLQTQDGTNKTNSFSFALTANTWTKVTKTF